MLSVREGKMGNMMVGRMFTDLMTESKLYTEEKDGNYFLEGIFMQGDVLNNNKRVYPTNILSESIEEYNRDYVEKKTGWGHLGHPDCYFLSDEELKDFYILTHSDGWKPFTSLSVGEEVLTRNPETNVIESNEIEKIIDQYYEGDAYHLKGRSIDATVTPNHKWLCRNKYGRVSYEVTEEIYNNRMSGGKKFQKYSIIKEGGIWVGSGDEEITIPGIDPDIYEKNKWRYNRDVSKPLVIKLDVFVKFLGIWLAEGHYSKEKYGVFISQNEGKRCQEIREMLQGFPIEWSERNCKTKQSKVTFCLSDARLHSYVSNLGDVYTKFIPYQIKQLSPDYLEELVYWFNIGDGRFGGHGGYEKRSIFSVSKRLIEDLHECLVKSGGSGAWKEIITEEDYMFADHIIKAENKKPLYQLSIHSTRGVYFNQNHMKITKKQVSGKIYCLRIKNNQNFYVKHKGKSYWTGNSPKIDLNEVAILTTSIITKGDDFYGKAKVCHEDCPKGKILRGLIKTGGNVGVSSRGLGTANKSTWNEEDCNMVDTFVLRAIDVVADPSAPDAMVRAIQEEKTYILDDSGDVVELNEENYRRFESKLSSLPVKQEGKNEVVFDAIKNFLNNLK